MRSIRRTTSTNSSNGSSDRQVDNRRGDGRCRIILVVIVVVVVVVLVVIFVILSFEIIYFVGFVIYYTKQIRMKELITAPFPKKRIVVVVVLGNTSNTPNGASKSDVMKIYV